MRQSRLFHGEHLPLRVAYQQLFEHLPAFPVHEISRGRPQISRDALLRALSTARYDDLLLSVI
jgi:hypothetical protein